MAFGFVHDPTTSRSRALKRSLTLPLRSSKTSLVETTPANIREETQVVEEKTVDENGENEDAQFRSEYDREHFKDIDEGARHLNSALPKLLKKGATYDRVEALLITWAKSDVKPIKEQAKRLNQLFNEEYKFNSVLEELSMDSEDAGVELRKHISDAIFRARNGKIAKGTPDEREERNLFILYYGGHGDKEKIDNVTTSNWVWKPTDQPSGKDDVAVVWTKHMDGVKDAKCDVLLLFDCCYAGGMVNPDEQWNYRCELLAAAGAKEKAIGSENNFTKALVEELTDQRKNYRQTVIRELRDAIKKESPTKRYRLYRTPEYVRLRSKRASRDIALSRLHNNDDDDSSERTLNEPLRTASDAGALLFLKFSGKPDIRGLIRMFEYSPTSLVHAQAAAIYEDELLKLLPPRIINAFRAGSFIVVAWMPLLLWDSLDPHPACQLISIVKGPELLRTSQQTQHIQGTVEKSGVTSSAKEKQQRAIATGALPADSNELVKTNTERKDTHESRESNISHPSLSSIFGKKSYKKSPESSPRDSKKSATTSVENTKLRSHDGDFDTTVGLESATSLQVLSSGEKKLPPLLSAASIKAVTPQPIIEAGDAQWPYASPPEDKTAQTTRLGDKPLKKDKAIVRLVERRLRAHSHILENKVS